MIHEPARLSAWMEALFAELTTVDTPDLTGCWATIRRFFLREGR